jgi:hypothetical protein
MYTKDTGVFEGGDPACKDGAVMNKQAALLAFWTTKGKDLVDMEWNVESVVADTAFTDRKPTGVIHMFANVTAHGLKAGDVPRSELHCPLDFRVRA